MRWMSEEGDACATSSGAQNNELSSCSPARLPPARPILPLSLSLCVGVIRYEAANKSNKRVGAQ